MKAMMKKIKNIIKFYLKIDKYGKIKNTNKNLKIGKNVAIGPLNQVSFGSNVYISSNVNISTSDNNQSTITIGDDVMIAHNVLIIGGNHNIARTDIPMRLQGVGKQGHIVINNDVWIGAGSIILTGVTIGQGSVIGAGSIVTKDIPDYSIAAGNPAVVVKSRK
ncbi:acyltransferase [Candidatus Sulfurimonas marisnigri]|nr:DapH/DapD/GlmU-related protein [Candidatus Sulfurimonas marisnigri]